MKPISKMSDTELLDRVFERVGVYVGRDSTGLAFHVVHDDHIVAGPWGDEQIARYFAICYLAAHALRKVDDG
jgi:hypothetical protein